jgi:hypothetical protein
MSPSTLSTAADLAEHLRLLRAERALAAVDGLDADAGYLAELNEEIVLARRAYVVVAVTEIATLRAELAGALLG